jgi:hypothetical protein
MCDFESIVAFAQDVSNFCWLVVWVGDLLGGISLRLIVQVG